ncbi:MAG: hypothetical protein LAT57_01045 [Balneolales bacterium]|nr:hypothetical protein [Balneolales bacterium]
MRLILIISVAIVFLLFVPELILAQTSPPPPALPGMPDQAPIDGGIALLAAAGGAYAWKRLRKSKS